MLDLIALVSRTKLKLHILMVACLSLMGPGFSVNKAQAEALQIHTLDIHPYGFEDKNGRIAGNLYEIANAIATEANVEFENSLVPLSRVVKYIQTNKPICTIVIRSEYSSEIAVPVANIHIDLHAGIIARKGIKLESYDDLDGLIIGLARGSYLEHPFDNDEKLQKHFVDGDRQAVKMLQMGRVDAVAGGISGLKFNMKSIEMPPEATEKPLILAKRVFWLHCAKSIQDRDLLERLRAAAEQLHKQGTIQKIWRKYEK